MTEGLLYSIAIRLDRERKEDLVQEARIALYLLKKRKEVGNGLRYRVAICAMKNFLCSDYLIQRPRYKRHEFESLPLQEAESVEVSDMLISHMEYTMFLLRLNSREHKALLLWLAGYSYLEMGSKLSCGRDGVTLLKKSIAAKAKEYFHVQ